MKRGRRDRAAALLMAPPLRSILKSFGHWTGVLVLNYHRVGNPDGQPWDRALWSATEEELDRHLATLTRCAEVIDPTGLLEAMRAGRGRRVLITFDDGYRDNYEIAFPLLRSHGLRATFFLATEFLDRPHAAWWDEIAWMVRHANGDAPLTGTKLSSEGLLPGGVSLATDDRDAWIGELTARYKTLPGGDSERFLDRLAHATGSGRCGTSDAEGLWMTWEMARELHATGMSIGGHTVTHPVLARIPPERQREEIAGCARRLAEELDVEMRWFAYPVGARDTFTRTTQDILRDAGVELAFSFYGGLAGPSHWNPLDVPRIHIGRELDARLLEATITLPQVFARP